MSRTSLPTKGEGPEEEGGQIGYESNFSGTRREDGLLGMCDLPAPAT